MLLSRGEGGGGGGDGGKSISFLLSWQQNFTKYLQ